MAPLALIGMGKSCPSEAEDTVSPEKLLARKHQSTFASRSSLQTQEFLSVLALDVEETVVGKV